MESTVSEHQGSNFYVDIYLLLFFKSTFAFMFCFLFLCLGVAWLGCVASEGLP